MRAVIRRCYRPALALGLLIISAGCLPEGDSQAAGKKHVPPRIAPVSAPAVRTAPLPTPSLHAPVHLAAVRSSFVSLGSAKVRREALRYPEAKQAVQQAPISLTAADGTGLKLISLRARAVVEGPLAFTELHLAFRNPKPKTIEGRFAITLPDGAAISRFAMRLPQGWQEAEVVERQRARKVYESFLHRKQDPALLEKKAGNAFRARIFPIPPRGIKEIRVSYSQQLDRAGEPYRLHLKGLPKMRHLGVEVLLGSGPALSAGGSAARASMGATLVSRQVARLVKRDFAPRQDFTVAPTANGPQGLRHGNLVLVRVRPQVTTRQAAMGSLLLLVDTSASRAAGFSGQVERLGAVVRALSGRFGAGLPIHVACYDQTVASIYDGPAGRFGSSHLQQILARRALGASDLAAALRWASGTRGFSRALLISDGVVTAGKRAGAALRGAVAGLSRAGIERLDVLLVGGIRDPALMRRLVGGTLRRQGVVLEEERPNQELAQRLGQRALSGVEVQIPGARWIWPTVLDGVQAGHEALIYADLPRPPRDGKLQVKLSGPMNQTHTVALAPTARPLLQRQWVGARIARLEHRRDTLGDGSPAAAEKVRQKIVALSTTHRVVSDHTAMLVLETEWDYRRFQLTRKALANILIVGTTGVELLQRKAGVYQRARNAGLLGTLRRQRGADLASIFGRDSSLGGLIGDQIGDSYGVGGLGIVGTGRGGGGTGEGTIGLGTLGTIGKGGGGGSGAGFGRGAGSPGRRHRGDEGKLGSRKPGSRIEQPARRSAGLRAPRGPSPRQRRTGLTGRRASLPRVALGQATVRGALGREIIRRIIRRHINEVRYCYQRELQVVPQLRGQVVVDFTIAATGQVVQSRVGSTTLGNRPVEQCIARAVRRWRFPRPATRGIVVVRYPFTLEPDQGQARVRLARSWGKPSPSPSAPVRPRKRTLTEVDRFNAVRTHLAKRRTEAALLAALRWRTRHPGSVLALVALGEGLAQSGQPALAARAYGSIIDLYPSRADMRRFAGARLESLDRAGRSLAADTYSVALEQRPDHVTGYRMLAYAQLQGGQPELAFATLAAGLARSYPSGRFASYRVVLREDQQLVAAAWLRRAGAGERRAILARLRRAKIAPAKGPSLHFVLSWETDANDVDLHVHDSKGGHAFYRQPGLPSGGRLLRDVTSGYGPEKFAIHAKPRGFPYQLKVHYYAKGPMGYGMGAVQVIRHDGDGAVRIESRPFVATQDGQYVDLGAVQREPQG
jgi:Vault protein inter-alpha-trypsin domain